MAGVAISLGAIQAARSFMAADPDHPWLAENPGPCQGCDGPGAIWYRTNSAYVDERQNWSWLCPQCQDRSDADYAEMWDEYWRERW